MCVQNSLFSSEDRKETKGWFYKVEGIIKRYPEIGDRPEKVREGVGAKKFGMSLETQGIKLFWRDIPGFGRDIPEAPEKFEKKMFGFNFWPLKRFYRTLVRGTSEPLTGFYRTFRIEHRTFLGQPFKISPYKGRFGECALVPVFVKVARLWRCGNHPHPHKMRKLRPKLRPRRIWTARIQKYCKSVEKRKLRPWSEFPPRQNSDHGPS